MPTNEPIHTSVHIGSTSVDVPPANTSPEQQDEWQKLNKAIDGKARDLDRQSALRKRRHLAQAQWWETTGMVLGITAAVFGVFTGFLTGSKTIDPIWAAFSSTILGVFVAVQAFLKPAERIQANKTAADHWSDLQEEADLLRTIDMVSPTMNTKQAETRLKELEAEKAKLIQTSPGLSGGVHRRVPELAISIILNPQTVAPREQVNVMGTLTAEKPASVPIAISVWSDAKGSDEKELLGEGGVKTRHNGSFTWSFHAPETPDRYLVEAHYRRGEGCARFEVRAPPPSAH